MADAAPRVSVIIPCFNLGQYLAEAVDSVLAQTYQDFEILIVDDGSTDAGTVAVLDAFERPKTTVFRTANQGLARARNFLIAKARGEYVSALDADDKLHPDYLQRTVGVLESEPRLSFVSTHLRMFGVQDGTWPNTDACDLPALLADDTVITPALVRRSAVLAVGGYDEHMPAQGDEDWELWIALVGAGYHGRILPDELFFYRRRHGSMVEQCTAGDVHLSLVRYIVEKHQDAYREHLLRVLHEKEVHVGQLRRLNVALEREIACALTPAVERARAELRALQSRLARMRAGASTSGGHASTEDLEARNAALTAQLAALHDEYLRAMREISDLRRSVSWRLTRPLRTVYDRLRRTAR